ncbi:MULTISPECIES: DUF3592 domain-containing protein [Salinibaculum]|uniref:DUF3592 domain-containing protein n=1 Tax=Salinibaculum TaxID=2732368 RepID=UPI0030D15E66
MDLRNLVLGLLVGLAFTGVGGFMIFTHYQATMHSTPVDGVVVESSVVDYNNGQSSGSSPDIEYRYTYKGTTYTSSKLCPGEYNNGCYGPDTEKVAQSVVDRYPEGSTATVHVDPDDPSNAYLLDADFPVVYLVPVGFGLLAIVGTVVPFVKRLFGARNERRQGGLDVSDGAAPSGEMTHPIVPVVLGVVMSAGGVYSVSVGAVLSGLIFAVLGLFVLYMGVRRLVWE